MEKYYIVRTDNGIYKFSGKYYKLGWGMHPADGCYIAKRWGPSKESVVLNMHPSQVDVIE
jgi:hypothetical protein